MSQEHLFASFILDRDAGIEIALPAEQVVEAIPMGDALQPLPSGAAFLEGLMPLRNDIIPVINLKKRLNLAATSYQRDAKVAVVQNRNKRFGLLFDDIRDVFRVPAEAVEHLDAFLLAEQAVIADLIKLEQGNRTLELLDLERLLPCGGEIDDVMAQHDQQPARARIYLQFVIFSCRGQVYGIPVQDAREISFFANIDTTFQSGKIEGALQLRGQTIPVLCSARLLGCPQEELKPTEDTRILVMQTSNMLFGLLVDKVHQILVVADDTIMRIPGGHLPHLMGVCDTPAYSNIMLLDVIALINSQAATINAMTRMGNGGSKQELRTATAARHIITEHCYLVFSIGKHYAIELKDVQEIIDCGDFMPTANGSGLVHGIINLRGRVVPVIGLRQFFGCPDPVQSSAAGKLIIGRANGNLVALLVDEIVTIYKQEQYHITPSLRPELQAKKDTLDRLIEFINQEGLKEHVLVVNVTNILRNHLQIEDCEEQPLSGETGGGQIPAEQQ